MPRQQDREPDPSREAREIFLRWLGYLDREIEKHQKPGLREELVQDNLHQFMLGTPKGGRLNFQLESELAYNVLQLSLMSRNITLEGEYDPGVDEEKYASIKPLIYFWQMFDRSPVGLNQWLGFRFRAMLGRHIFKKIGKDVRIYSGLTFYFGYHITIEDGATIYRDVTLDDRQELTVEKDAVVAERTRLGAGPKQGDGAAGQP